MAEKIIKFLFSFLLISTFLTACHANGDMRNKSKDDQPDINAVQLISRSFARGEISRDEAALYKTYAIFDIQKLPEKFRSRAPQKDATMIIRQLKKDFDSLGEETKEKIRPYLFKRKGDQ